MSQRPLMMCGRTGSRVYGWAIVRSRLLGNCVPQQRCKMPRLATWQVVVSPGQGGPTRDHTPAICPWTRCRVRPLPKNRRASLVTHTAAAGTRTPAPLHNRCEVSRRWHALCAPRPHDLVDHSVRLGLLRVKVLVAAEVFCHLGKQGVSRWRQEVGGRGGWLGRAAGRGGRGVGLGPAGGEIRRPPGQAAGLPTPLRCTIGVRAQAPAHRHARTSGPCPPPLASS
jgi:hypothetical protein